MTELERIRALLVLVYAAGGPSREIDAKLRYLLAPDYRVLLDGGDVRRRIRGAYGALRDWPIDDDFGDWDGVASHIGAARYSASQDAALEVAMQVEPRDWWEVGWTASPGEHDGVAPALRHYCCRLPLLDFHVEGFGQTAPLAIIAALLRARAVRLEVGMGLGYIDCGPKLKELS